jgi:acyl-CoA thioesterase FadM
MIQRYTGPFQVRSDDVDAWGEAPIAGLAAYFEQAARDASTAAGFGDDWYAAQGTAWVIRRLTLARLRPICYHEAITVETWVSRMGRVRSDRDYELRDAAGRLAAAGRGDWVYVDRAKGAPKGVDRAVLGAFTPQPPAPLAPPEPAGALPAPPRTFVWPHRAHRYEADSMGHINNTVYLRWLAEAADCALADAGLPLTPAGGPGLRLQGDWYVVDYLRAAMPGDDLEIGSRLSGVWPDGALAWEQEVRRGGEALLRCASRQRLTAGDAARVSLAAALAALTGP